MFYLEALFKFFSNAGYTQSENDSVFEYQLFIYKWQALFAIFILFNSINTMFFCKMIWKLVFFTIRSQTKNTFTALFVSKC